MSKFYLDETDITISYRMVTSYFTYCTRMCISIMWFNINEKYMCCNDRNIRLQLYNYNIVLDDLSISHSRINNILKVYTFRQSSLLSSLLDVLVIL